jgi:hypothetical protein
MDFTVSFICIILISLIQYLVFCRWSSSQYSTEISDDVAKTEGYAVPTRGSWTVDIFGSLY